MQQNFPKAVMAAVALAFGFVADVPSEFIPSISLISSSTLFERSSLGKCICFANDEVLLHFSGGEASTSG